MVPRAVRGVLEVLAGRGPELRQMASTVMAAPAVEAEMQALAGRGAMLQRPLQVLVWTAATVGLAVMEEREGQVELGAVVTGGWGLTAVEVWVAMGEPVVPGVTVCAVRTPSLVE